MTTPQRPGRARKTAELVTLVLFLAGGLWVVFANTPSCGYSSNAVYLIPLVLAALMARTVAVGRRSGVQAVFVGLLAVLLTAGLSCAAVLSNLEACY